MARKTATAKKFSLSTWEANVSSAVQGAETSGVALTKLVREAAPHNLDKDKAREVFQLAYGAVYAQLNGVTIEEAITTKTVRNRVSDCLCVLYAPAVVGEGDKALRVDSLVGSIQTVAAKVRAASPKQERAPKAPKAPKETGDKTEAAAEATGLAMLQNALNVCKAQMAGNAAALELLAELVDLAGDLASALGADATDLAEAA